MTAIDGDMEMETGTAAPHDEAQATWLRAASGQIVRVHLLEGKTLTGQLLAFDHSALVIQGSSPTPLLVFKQCIAYLAVEERGAQP